MMSQPSKSSMVDHNGTVTWFPPVVYKSSCKINVLYYPFDEQNCTIKIGTWTHDGSTLDLVPVRNSAIRKDYWPNGEWVISDMPCLRHVVKYPCCEEVYIDVTYFYLSRRQPLYYFDCLLPGVYYYPTHWYHLTRCWYFIFLQTQAKRWRYAQSFYCHSLTGVTPMGSEGAEPRAPELGGTLGSSLEYPFDTIMTVIPRLYH